MHFIKKDMLPRLYILVDLALNLIYSTILPQNNNNKKPKKQEKKNHWSNFSILFPSLLPPFFFPSCLIAVLLPLLTMGWMETTY